MRPDMTTAAADLVGRRDEWPWSRSYDRLLRGGRGFLIVPALTVLLGLTAAGDCDLPGDHHFDRRRSCEPPGGWIKPRLGTHRRPGWICRCGCPGRQFAGPPAWTRQVLARAFAVVVSVVALFLLFDVLVLEGPPWGDTSSSVGVLVGSGRKRNQQGLRGSRPAARRAPRTAGEMRRPSSARGAGRLGVGGP